MDPPGDPVPRHLRGQKNPRTIKNTANKDLGINIVGEIRNAKTDVLLSTSNDYVSTTEGGTSAWSLDTYIDKPVDITCKVTEVNNWFN